MADLIVAGARQIPSGSGARFTARSKHVALFNVEGTIRALAVTCPHHGDLRSGKAQRHHRDCPAHGMKFDVTTGFFSGASAFGIRSLLGKLVDENIIVSLNGATGV